MEIHKGSHEYWTIGRLVSKGEWYTESRESFHVDSKEKAAILADERNAELDGWIASGYAVLNPSAKFIPVRVVRSYTVSLT